MNEFEGVLNLELDGSVRGVVPLMGMTMEPGERIMVLDNSGFLLPAQVTGVSEDKAEVVVVWG